MVRLPAVAGRFYPSNPDDLRAAVRQYTTSETDVAPTRVKACLVPHAGYMYSGHVSGAVFARVALPKRILLLGVRHFPRGEALATLTSGAWRTPLGEVPVDEELASALQTECPSLREDALAHSAEHSLEVQLPFLQVLRPEFSFVPVALGTARFEELAEVGRAIARVLKATHHEVLLLTTSDLNHYEQDAVTRVKDGKAIEQLLAVDPRGLYDACSNLEISMCGLGPATAMLTALRELGGAKAALVRYATSAEVSGDASAVVGYAGMIFA